MHLRRSRFLALAVAAPVAGNVSRPSTFAVPLTSRVAPGVVVPMPTLAVAPVPAWNTTESITVEAPLKMGRKSAVPPVVVTSVAVAGAALLPRRAGAGAWRRRGRPGTPGTRGIALTRARASIH